MTDDSYRRISDGPNGATLTDAGGLRRISEGDRPEPATASPSAPTLTDTPSLDKSEPTTTPSSPRLRKLKSEEPVRDEKPSAPAAPVSPPEGNGSARSGWFTVAVAAIVVAVILAAGVIFLAVHGGGGVSDSMRTSAQRAASGDAALLASYDYRNLTGPGSAWSKVEKQATPAFKKSFLSTSGDLGKLLTQYNATATAKVLTTGIASISSKRAVVLVFLDQTVTNQVQKSTNTSQPLRVEIVLSRQGGKWLVDNLQVPK